MHSVAAESSPTFRPDAESVSFKEDPDVKTEYSDSSPSAAGPPKLPGAAAVLPRSIKVEDEEKPDLDQFPLKADSQKMAEMAPSADDSLPSIKAEDTSIKTEDNSTQMADNAPSVPVKIQDTKYLPVANAAKELLSRSDPRSGASTPGFVRTTAEVADTAALLDREEPEPEISDGEAGMIGYRRLSSTPIPEVARTAAEVADTAEKLDNVEVNSGPATANTRRLRVILTVPTSRISSWSHAPLHIFMSTTRKTFMATTSHRSSRTSVPAWTRAKPETSPTPTIIPTMRDQAPSWTTT